MKIHFHSLRQEDHFLFRLRATEDAQPGTITGTISAGTAISVNVSVSVDVPPVNDDIELTVSTWHEVFWDPRVDVKARNKGPRAGTLKLDVSSSENIVVFTPCRECSRTDKNSIHCVTDLDKGASFRMSIWAFGLPHRGGTITVTASLGNARKTVTVPVKTRPDHPPVEDVVKPTDAQEADLTRLQDATNKAVSILQAACPDETPLTPPGRLDAMEARLKAMIEAANTVKPALVAFYDTLSNEQKARFNRMGRDLAASND